MILSMLRRSKGFEGKVRYVACRQICKLASVESSSLSSGHLMSSCAGTGNFKILAEKSSMVQVPYPTIRRWKHKGRIGNRLENLKAELLEEQHERAKGGRKKKDKKGRTSGSSRINTVEEENPAVSDVTSPGDDFDDDEANEEDGTGELDEAGPQLPNVQVLKNKMTRVVDHLEKSLKSIRGSEPTPEMFENITVMAYGTASPISSVAQVIIVSPTMAKCVCFDPATAKDVRDAIRDGGLNLNPRIDDAVSGEVIIPVPKVSTETRKLLQKQIGKMGESARSRIRNLRRAAHDTCKKGQAGKLEGISKDDAFRVSKDVDAATDEMISTIDKVIEAKQDAVLKT